MREAFVIVRCRKKYKATTDSNHQLPVFENQLNRQFDVAVRLSLCLRYHIHLDSGRLVVSCGCHRFVLQKDGGLEHELSDESNTGL